jgi:hypothetical protein
MSAIARKGDIEALFRKFSEALPLQGEPTM